MLSFPSPEDLPDPGIEPRTPELQADSLPSELQGSPKVPQSCPTLCDPMNYTVHGIIQARILEWVTFPFSRESNPGPPHCRQILLPAEPQGKPKNTGMGSLSLLQGIFPTQESNQGLLHCRRVLYQLSYEEAHNGRRETKKHCFKDTYFEHCLKTKLCNNENSFKMVTWRKIKSRMRHI